ncbi:Clan SC, family S9, unassigned serine peptidase [Histomonas meleagridis]|uniref:Clan SC, family S9, unassigned serine peptidase n=1 Tax=Histomonas meleagridis TaxID=135588 RepID=UPI00355A940C|nr:Clan SC, family S9, unassigned serine peptidase [Histomonas meleagridis]KAH0801706.1 Clan SC, family S9, unassigned serine peptidase [Histomonas meleagridis]
MGSYIEMGFQAICRPPRTTYEEDKIPNTMLIEGYGEIRRHPVSFPNSRGQKIIGSFYPPNEMPENPSCVIYLHGNASSQIEGTFLIPILVPLGISVLCFDFSGCGMSEGNYISLGLLEKDDVSGAIAHLLAKYRIKRFALYGRSMGAATCFFSIADNPFIECAVADSPFASLPQLISEIVQQYHVPGFMSSFLTWIISGKTKELVGFDVRDCVPIKYAPQCHVPIMIIHGQKDDFINCSHSRDLYDQYGCSRKEIRIVHGNHNSERPIQTVFEAVQFITNVLNVPFNLQADQIHIQIESAYNHFSNVQEMIDNYEQ